MVIMIIPPIRVPALFDSMYKTVILSQVYSNEFSSSSVGVLCYIYPCRDAGICTVSIVPLGVIKRRVVISSQLQIKAM